MRHDGTRYLIIILALAALARVAVALIHPFSFPDSVDYDTLGRALAHGTEYISGGMRASRIPGYPLFLAGCYLLFGDSSRAALILQALICGGSAIWAYLLCERWDRRCALLAAALVAIDPLSVAFSAALLSEALFTFFMLGALVAMQRLGRSSNRSIAWGAWLVVSWVTAIYLRPSVLWCAVPIVGWHAWLAWRKRDGMYFSSTVRLAGWVLAAYVVTAVALVPWWNRNYALFHTGYWRMTTLDGKFLYESLSPQTTGKPAMEKIITPADMVDMNEGEQADEFKRRAWGFARADLLREVRMAFVKAGRTWNPLLNAEEFQSVAVQAVAALWHVPLYLVAIIGAWQARRRIWDLGILLWPMAYFTAVHMVYLGSVRYRVPLMPLLCVLAARGVWTLVERWMPARQRETADK